MRGERDESSRTLGAVGRLALSSLLVAVGLALTNIGGSSLGGAPRTVLQQQLGLHRAAKQALAVPGGGGAAGARGGRTQQLAASDIDHSAAEEARCVGLLHSCQTWLELRDGQENNIVITSPEEDAHEIVNKNITLPESGAQIGDGVWSVLQESCKYGLADLRSCGKPKHWPVCTGVSCTTR